MLSDKYLDLFFNGIELKKKSILDIGCGNGDLLKYAQSKGAVTLLGLEPNIKIDKSNEIDILTDKIQDFKTRELFDLIVLHDSINHLDEDSCRVLDTNESAKGKYDELLVKINQLLNDSGKIILADASRRNFFADLNLKNPFDKTIEWHKHQTPQTWIKVLTESGFINPQISWLTSPRLLKWDKLVGNMIVSYFLVSHFRLVMDKA